MTDVQKVQVLRQLAVDYHSGQASRGYRLSCLCYYWAKRRGVKSLPTGGMTRAQRALYDTLADRYGGVL